MECMKCGSPQHWVINCPLNNMQAQHSPQHRQPPQTTSHGYAGQQPSEQVEKDAFIAQNLMHRMEDAATKTRTAANTGRNKRALARSHPAKSRATHAIGTGCNASTISANEEIANGDHFAEVRHPSGPSWNEQDGVSTERLR